MKHNFFKIRLIANQTTSSPTYGITIPIRMALNFTEVYFTIKASGNAIILESGIPIGELKNG